MTEESSTSGLACQALDEVETEVLRLVSETHRGESPALNTDRPADQQAFKMSHPPSRSH